MIFRVKHVKGLGYYAQVKFNEDFGWKVIGPKNEFGYHSLYPKGHREAPMPNKKAAKIRALLYNAQCQKAIEQAQQ